MSKKSGKWVTVKEAVEILGVSDKTVRRRIKTGHLKAKKVGRAYLIYMTAKVKETKKREDSPGEKTKADEKESVLLDTIIEQLKEKDNQLQRLDERLRETNILLMEFRRLLPAPEESVAEGEVEGAEADEVDTPVVKKKQKKQKVWRFVRYLIILGVVSGIAVSIVIIRMG